MRITVSAPTTPRAPRVLGDTAVVEYRFFEDILASAVSAVVSVATTTRWSTREVAPASDVILSPFAFDVATSARERTTRSAWIRTPRDVDPGRVVSTLKYRLQH